MKVLVIGSGGREHTVVFKLSQSPLVTELYCAPGNGGIASIAKCIDIKATDIEGVVEFSKDNKIDLVVVTPDDPLMLGMVDALENAGIKAFGPRKNAAIIEGSKAFSKELMKKYNIPTAGYETFEDFKSAIKYLQEQNKYPTVIKADGLALGKGVIIANCFDEAKAAVLDIMDNKVFGSSGDKVVIEEFLTGPEVSVLAFCDGKTIVPMVSAQDHKRAFDNDMGPNTGGMGTFSPSRYYTKEIESYCYDNIFLPTMNALNNEGRKFKGVIFFGLMLTSEGPKVIEYNARLGDPETQVVLTRLESDLCEIFHAVVSEKLDNVKIRFDNNAACCVIIASDGYPLKYETGFEISGICEAEKESNIKVFHAGTKMENGVFKTSGGRVLGVTAVSENLDTAIKDAYTAASKIKFNKAFYRKDIGVK